MQLYEDTFVDTPQFYAQYKDLSSGPYYIRTVFFPMWPCEKFPTLCFSFSRGGK